MKTSYASIVALACAALAGCSAQVDDSSIGVSQEGLTLQQCADQRDACVKQFGFLGALTICPTQYSTCSLTASNALPAQVTDAVSDAANCVDEFGTCSAAATSPSELVACTEAQAQCVAGILDVELPSIVTGTTTCVETSVDCINDAASVSDLTSCAGDLTDCAVAQAETVIPQEVIDIVTDVTSCTTDLNACVRAASTPSAVTACTEAEAVCVAGTLDVELPNIPVSEVLSCTEAAADCTLEASRLSDIAACTEDLLDCNADVVASLEAPPVLDCAQVWTACMVRNPFGFFTCAAERRACDAANP